MSPTGVFSDVPILTIYNNEFSPDHIKYINFSRTSSHLCAAHDTGHGNYNTQRRYVETMKEVTDY